MRLLAMAGGIVAGAVLGVFGTKHTKFENTPEGIFYTPNAHIGIALSVIFGGRVLYRMFQLYSMDPNVQPNPSDFASSPLTLSIFGLLAGYYVTYAIGLLRYRSGVERAMPPP
jgi:prolipoprotein diacylglyceryltransferase